MASLTERLAAARRRHPGLDHAVATQEHYGATKASQQAGAVTYFGFLSFFPILALAFFVVGYVVRVYPGAESDLLDAIDSILPNVVGDGEGEIPLDSIQRFSGLAGLIGVLGVLYAGLNWVSALRDALQTVFETPAPEQPGFVAGKLRDLLGLLVIGAVLLVAVAVAGFVSAFSTAVLEFVGLDTELGWAVRVLAVTLGLAANALMFFMMFKLLAEPALATRSLVSGAILGAVAFEVLKQVSAVLLGLTKNSPAFQAFGIALILVVWINYFSRVVLYAAAWAHTVRAERDARAAVALEPVHGPATPSLATLPSGVEVAATVEPPVRRWLGPFAAGGAAALVVAALVRRNDP